MSIDGCDALPADAECETQSASTVRVVDLVAVTKDLTTPKSWEMLWKSTKEKQASLAQLFHKQLPADAILGVGTFGKVWRAKDADGKLYAVKNLSEKYAQREIEVFEHLKSQKHPCVVGLFDVHYWEGLGLVSLVMEMCPGGDLFNIIKAAKTSTATYIPHKLHQCWLAQTMLGLEFLHSETKTMFRDLKPANLILDSEQRIKLTDFGVSKLDVTSTGAFTFGNPAGSPGYVSPEILRQQPYDTKADWFSFGVLLWVVITGGMLKFSDPQPPTNARCLKREDVKNGNYSAIFDDYLVLIELVMDETAERSLPIAGDAKDLVLRLVVENPVDRLDATGIRAHPYFASLRLSEAGNDTPSVLAWIRSAEELIQSGSV